MQFAPKRSCAHVFTAKEKNSLLVFPLDFGVRQTLISISTVPISRLCILEQVMEIICLSFLTSEKRMTVFPCLSRVCWEHQIR